MNEARDHRFVIDEPTHTGGPGEEVTPAELFLAGVSACGVLLVESFARRDGLPLRRAEAVIEGVRDEADTSVFREVRLRFSLEGVDRQQANDLVERYKRH
jgi:uncharacterized OsmC-like protein